GDGAVRRVFRGARGRARRRAAGGGGGRFGLRTRRGARGVAGAGAANCLIADFGLWVADSTSPDPIRNPKSTIHNYLHPLLFTSVTISFAAPSNPNRSALSTR